MLPVLSNQPLVGGGDDEDDDDDDDEPVEGVTLILCYGVCSTKHLQHKGFIKN